MPVNKKTTKPVSRQKKATTNKGKKKTTKRKVIKKKVAKKQSPRKKTTKKTLSEVKEREKKIELEKEFVVINETDPEEEVKSKLTWIIVGIIAIFLVSFWFWGMKENIKKNQKNKSTERISTEINQTIDEIKTVFQNTSEMIGYASDDLTKQQRLEELKNEILNQIQNNLDVQNWPKHSSELIGLEIQYPPQWSKTETANELSINSYIGTSTPEFFATVNIYQEENRQNIDIDQWSKLQSKFQITDDMIISTTTIDNLTAFKYIDNKEDSDLKWLILTKNNQVIYSIQVIIENSKDLYQDTIEQILSTIKFIK